MFFGYESLTKYIVSNCFEIFCQLHVNIRILQLDPDVTLMALILRKKYTFRDSLPENQFASTEQIPDGATLKYLLFLYFWWGI